MSFVTTRQRIKPSLHPRGGYTFKDSLGVTHVAPNLQKLVEVVTKYRERLSLPPGDPLAEITAQICKRQPNICTNHEPSISSKTLLVHVLHDVAKATLPFDLVPVPEVERRVEICSHCPFAVNLMKLCAPCYEPAKQKVRSLLSPTPVSEKIEGLCCAKARDVIWLSANRQNHRKCAEAPEPCWRHET